MGFDRWSLGLNRNPPQMWFLYQEQAADIRDHMWAHKWQFKPEESRSDILRFLHETGRKESESCCRQLMGGMFGGGWTRSYPVLQSSTMSKHVLATFFFTSNLLALIWWDSYFFQIQKTELPFPVAGVVIWASTPISTQAHHPQPGAVCHVLCVCAVSQ